MFDLWALSSCLLTYKIDMVSLVPFPPYLDISDHWKFQVLEVL